MHESVVALVEMKAKLKLNVKKCERICSTKRLCTNWGTIIMTIYST